MTDKVKSFIEEYHELLHKDLKKLFLISADKLSTNEIYELSTILDAIGFKTEPIRYDALDELVRKYIQDMLNAPSYVKDKSNSWARVDYMLEEVSTMGFGYEAAKKHIIDNGDRYNTSVRPLSPDYGWMGSGDYAFKWFSEKEFDKEYKFEP